MGGKGKSFGKGSVKGKGADKGKGKGKEAPAKGDVKGKGQGKGKGKGKAEAPAASNSLDILVGTDLQAMYDGTLYKATVVQVRKKAPQVKVRYAGYDEAADAWLGLDEIRSKLLKGGAAAGGKGGAGGSGSVTDLPLLGWKCYAQTAPDSQFFPGTILETSTANNRAKAPVKVSVEMWLPMIALRSIQKPGGINGKGFEDYEKWGYEWEEPVAKGKGKGKGAKGEKGEKGAKGAKGVKGGKGKSGKGKGYDDDDDDDDVGKGKGASKGDMKGKGKGKEKGKAKGKGKGKGK